MLAASNPTLACKEQYVNSMKTVVFRMIYLTFKVIFVHTMQLCMLQFVYNVTLLTSELFKTVHCYNCILKKHAIMILMIDLNSDRSKLMRLWYLSHRRPAKAQASLCIRAVSPEPSLFAHINMEVDEGSDRKSDI